MNHSHPDQTPHDGRFTSWTTLLAHWTRFAQAAAALPPGQMNDRWRQSVAPALGLHATAMALAETGNLPPSERPLALDRAVIGIQGFEATLRTAWPAAELPPRLAELIDDAHQALRNASALTGTPTRSSPEPS